MEFKHMKTEEILIDCKILKLKKGIITDDRKYASLIATVKINASDDDISRLNLDLSGFFVYLKGKRYSANVSSPIEVKDGVISIDIILNKPIVNIYQKISDFNKVGIIEVCFIESFIDEDHGSVKTKNKFIEWISNIFLRRKSKTQINSGNKQ